jgi:hypothetical protein
MAPPAKAGSLTSESGTSLPCRGLSRRKSDIDNSSLSLETIPETNKIYENLKNTETWSLG